MPNKIRFEGPVGVHAIYKKRDPTTLPSCTSAIRKVCAMLCLTPIRVAVGYDVLETYGRGPSNAMEPVRFLSGIAWRMSGPDSAVSALSVS